MPGARSGDHERVRTLGVEEELLVVDPSGVPVPLGPQALEAAARRGEGETVGEHDRASRDDGAVDSGGNGDDEATDPPGHLVPELKAQQIELGTRVCRDLAEVTAELRHWRARADAAARAAGARVAALASSPVRVEPVTTPGERYADMTETFGLTALEQLTCGCHVHVSVADDEEGVAVLNRIRVWLPVLTALTANSPFWLGRDSGYASFRSQSWNRWPSSGPTELFADAAEYRQVVADLVATRTIVDTGMVYFDARLSERWPTVEVRIADVALRVEDAVTHAGLVRALVETAAREWRDGVPAPGVRSELVRVAGWRAARSGIDAELVSPLDGRPAPAADVVAALLEHVRPALAEAGDEERVSAGVATILSRGTGAQEQRRVHVGTGDLTAVVRAAIEVTTAG
ncbi:carboxylate-amine ligase [Trujillonella endophytica]|uniref:Putative glutamate--cysteine ligase 2 n=1 Tax=Trujillonella endophytica TaxID=673521 RepID=A0A1H8T493_9ACTN|nr:glutamate--cysteine ligase [Trujillella endophytica]SEO85682.1 carboxylate-amine ligase [Trujillella endophytica]